MNLLSDITFFPTISLVVSESCRMKCKFCCENDKSIMKVDKDEIIKIIDILNANGTKRICYTGGEPLLSPYLEEYLKRAHNYNIKNTLMTSDGKKLKKLSIPKEYVATVRLSIHGVGKEHDEITCVENSFTDLENSLKNATKYPISISCVLTPKIKDKLDELIEWSIKQGATDFYLTNLLRNGAGNNYINEHGRVSFADFQKLINNLKNKYHGKIRIIDHDFETNAQCIIIYSNGDIYVNPYFGEVNNRKCIGNIFKECPKDIFKKFKDDKNIYDDYIKRLSKSTLWEQILL